MSEGCTMRMNIYTLEVHRRDGQPLIVVTIRHTRLHGVYFFTDMESANRFIAIKKVELRGLTYDPEVSLSETATVLQYVLNDPNIVIGKDGRTYDKRFMKEATA